MKYAMLLALLGTTAANAGTMCLNFTTYSQYNRLAPATAQCEVTQSMDPNQLSGNWTCSFNGGATQTLNDYWADYLTDGTDGYAPTLAYAVEAGLPLGDFLFNGLNLQTSDVPVLMGGTLELVLGDTPTNKYEDLNIIDQDWNFSYIHLAASTYGSCGFPAPATSK